MSETSHSLLTRLFLLIIRGYQLLFSSFFGRSCRYHPTCSSYTSTAIKRFGAVRGGFMGFTRICRCHPFHPGGYDPVPEIYQNPFSKILLAGRRLVLIVSAIPKKTFRKNKD